MHDDGATESGAVRGFPDGEGKGMEGLGCGRTVPDGKGNRCFRPIHEDGRRGDERPHPESLPMVIHLPYSSELEPMGCDANEGEAWMRERVSSDDGGCDAMFARERTP